MSDVQNDEAEMLQQYFGKVKRVFSPVFQNASDRFFAGEILLNRFKEAIDTVIRKGRQHFHAVDEAHNELCVAKAIIENPHPLLFSKIEYEPPINGTLKTIDFCCSMSHGETVWIDVKTIKPKYIDKWDQFQKVQKKGLFPKNVHVCLSENWLGGEIWHGLFAARDRFLEYSLELEEKIIQGLFNNQENHFILFLCGEGFIWHQDELEDFVAFYRSGIHRHDDPFSKMETHSLQKRVEIRRLISNFACMKRFQFEIYPESINWNVLPPKMNI